MISGFLSARECRTKVGSVYSSYKNVKVDEPQGSVLLLFLLGIYMCDFLCDSEADVTYCAVNTNRHHCESNMDYANPEEKCQ